MVFRFSCFIRCYQIYLVQYCQLEVKRYTTPALESLHRFCVLLLFLFVVVVVFLHMGLELATLNLQPRTLKTNLLGTNPYEGC